MIYYESKVKLFLCLTAPCKVYRGREGKAARILSLGIKYK